MIAGKSVSLLNKIKTNKALGELEPIAENKTKESRQLNRRVLILYQISEKPEPEIITPADSFLANLDKPRGGGLLANNRPRPYFKSRKFKEDVKDYLANN